jgi:hypothetical protein
VAQSLLFTLSREGLALLAPSFEGSFEGTVLMGHSSPLFSAISALGVYPDPPGRYLSSFTLSLFHSSSSPFSVTGACPDPVGVLSSLFVSPDSL